MAGGRGRQAGIRPAVENCVAAATPGGGGVQRLAKFNGDTGPRDLMVVARRDVGEPAGGVYASVGVAACGGGQQSWASAKASRR